MGNAVEAGETLTIPKRVAEVLFDALMHSLDFGSGFLDNEEISALRWLSAAFGQDPDEAIPSDFECARCGQERFLHVEEVRDRWLISDAEWGRNKAKQVCTDFTFVDQPFDGRTGS